VPVQDVRYAKAADGTHIAYRELVADAECETTHDIVMVSGGLIPMELFDEEPGCRRLLDGLRAFGRVVIFDRRGLGQSDPVVDWSRPITEQWADDLAAVIEASAAENPVVFSWDGYGVATRFAARHPDGLRALVLFHAVWSADEQYDEWKRERLETLRRNLAGDHEDMLSLLAPSRASDPAFRSWYTRAGQLGASPSTASRIWESVLAPRFREQPLEAIAVPTTLLCRRDNVYATPQESRGIAAIIPDARVVELEGGDHFPFVGDVDALVGELASLIVGKRSVPPPERVLAAVMFTDLVGSTERAVSLGDAAWKSLLDHHDSVVRASVDRSGGTVVKTTGDGVLALLPSAGVAIATAQRLRAELVADGMDVYIGIHVGDIVVTAPVTAAVLGQRAAFDPIGVHTLKGVPGEWELFRVVPPTPRS
jgi:pimeloyl-ACP methyl ester carboxylesterase